MRRSRLGSYALWQARDYLMDRGIPTLIVSVLFGYLTVAPMVANVRRGIENMPQRLIAKYGSIELARVALLKDINEPFLRTFLGVIVFLGALLAMNGVIANDRNKGYYRFLFAKPVSPLRYYGQAFVVHWAGFLAISVLLALLYGQLVSPLLSGPLLAGMATMFLLYGGIVFALSAAFRRDWLLLVLITALSTYLWDRFGESESILSKLLYLLPPLNRTTEIYYAVASHSAVNWRLLSWFGAYGAACVVAGLLVIHTRRMGESQ
jgi:hypothetical protein